MLQVPTRNLNVYIEALTAFSPVFSPNGLNNTLLLQGYVLENGSHYGNEPTFQGQGANEELIAWVQFEDQLEFTTSQ